VALLGKALRRVSPSVRARDERKMLEKRSQSWTVTRRLAIIAAYIKVRIDVKLLGLAAPASSFGAHWLEATAAANCFRPI